MISYITTIFIDPITVSYIPIIFLQLADLLLIAFIIWFLLSKARLDWNKIINSTLRWVLQKLYHVEVIGVDNFQAAGNRVLIVANHVSFIDAILLGLFLPEKPVFATTTSWQWHPIIRFFASSYGLFTINPDKSTSTKELVQQIKKNNRVVIFPEGRLTTTGRLMKIYEDSGLIVEKSNATILPVYIDGAQDTFFSKARRFKGIEFPKITLTIFPPKKLNPPKNLTAEDRRRYINQHVYDIMASMAFKASGYNKTLTQKLIETTFIYGRGYKIISDFAGNKFSYGRLIMAATILGKKIANKTEEKESVGIMLPSLAITIVTFFALHFYKRIPAMINFSAGSQNILEHAKICQIKTIYTSKRFIKTAGLQSLIKQLETELNIAYLEDIRHEVNLWDKIQGFLASCFMPGALATKEPASPDDPAAILFTSGSGSKPKGVVLSHANFNSNCAQVASLIDFSPSDKLLSVLPMFHSFGLTMGALMPILNGIKTFFYPSPLHFHAIPEIAYHIDATILLGTDTFLNHYARHAHNYDFYKIRHVFTGGEKLKEGTRTLWAEKFGIRLLEGYGATETASVLAVNTPMEYKTGTVGRFLPGIEYYIEPIEGIAEGGRLHVKSPAVMMGYLVDENKKRKKSTSPKRGEGWYDTGDIVSIDEEGFVKIIGREKRFAKVGGERISLVAIEEFITGLWPSDTHAVITAPDKRKGEKLVLITTKANLNREDMLKNGRKVGMSALYIPREIHVVTDIPLLATGKINYPSLSEMFVQPIL